MITIIGEPPNDNGTCPKCEAEVWPQGMYGMLGGGIGWYTCCMGEGCDWFYKVLDREADDGHTNGQ